MRESGERPLRASRVVLASEHAMLGEAFAAFLGESRDVRVVGTLHVDEALSERVSGLSPDVVVIDLGDGPTRAGAVVQTIRRSPTPPAVVVVSASTDAELVVEAACAGADGWVAKTGSLEDLVDAIRVVRDGDGWYPPQHVGAILRALRRSTSGTPITSGLPAELSPRETEVLGYLLGGSRDSGIAASMRVSLPTVRTHVRNVLRKLGVHSRVDAARLAADAGMEPLAARSDRAD